MPAAVARALREVIESAVRTAGAECEDVSVRAAGRRSVVRVVIDAGDDAEGGLDLDAVADVSRLVGEALDAADGQAGSPVPEAYTLEVTTPGVDRPLTLPRHWRRAVGRLVEVQRTDGGPLTGRVVSADEAGATLQPQAKGKKAVTPEPVTVSYGDVARAVVQIEFGPTEE